MKVKRTLCRTPHLRTFQISTLRTKSKHVMYQVINVFSLKLREKIEINYIFV